MPRDFNGSTAQWVGSAGTNGITFGTIVAIAKIDVDSVANGVYLNRDTAANRAGLIRESTNALAARFSGSVSAPTITWTSSDGWVLVAVCKATGTATPRYGKYVYSTGTWSFEDAGSTTGNANSAFIQTNIGHRANDQRFDGQIAVVGVYDYKLTDDQIKALAFTLSAWYAMKPKGLWVFDQADTAIKVIDRSGGGANESSLTGTTVGTSSPPSFSYGAPILIGRGAAAASGPITVDVLAASSSWSSTTPTVAERVGVQPAGRTDSALAPTVAIQPSPGAALSTWSSTAPTISFVYPKAETLEDDFDDNTINTAKWTTTTSGSATVSETSQQLHVTLNASATSQGAINSLTQYDLEESEIRVQIADLGSVSATKQIYLRAKSDASNQVYIRYLNGNVQAVQNVAGTTTQLASSAATPTNFRVREASGTTYWEYSTDGGSNWTTLHSASDPIDLSVVTLEVGVFNSAGGGGTVKFDNFNLRGMLTLDVPAAGATFSAPTVTAQIALAPSSAGSTWGATIPTVAWRASVPAADSTWSSTSPTAAISPSIPAAGSTWSSSARAAFQISAPSAGSTWGATAPTINLPIVIAVPAASATWSATPPVPPVVISPPAAGSTWSSSAPGVRLVVSVPSAGATWGSTAPSVLGGTPDIGSVDLGDSLVGSLTTSDAPLGSLELSDALLGSITGSDAPLGTLELDHALVGSVAVADD